MGVDVLQETLDGVGICCGVRVYVLSDVLVGCGVTLKKYRMYSWGCVWSEVVRWRRMYSVFLVGGWVCC